MTFSLHDGWVWGPSADAEIVVRPNHPPVALSFQESGVERSPLVIDGWSYWDADGDIPASIWIDSLPHNGILFLDVNGDSVVDTGEAIQAGQEIAWADSATSRMVKFLPAGDSSGSTSLTYRVDDGQDEGSSAYGTIVIAEASGPDAWSFRETGYRGSVTVIDGWWHSDDNGDYPTGLRVTELPDNGVLFLDVDRDNTVDPGEAIAVNQEIDWTTASGSRMVKFAPDTDWYGTTTLTYAIRDWLEYGTPGHVTIRVVDSCTGGS